MNYNLFIITSPLQLINAVEARENFRTKNNKLVAIFTEFESKNKTQIKKLIDEKEWNDVLYFNFKSKNSKTTFFRQIKLVKILKSTNYNNVFCGDLSSSIKLILANIKKTKVYLLDDGAATINRHNHDLNAHNQNKKQLKKIFREIRFHIFGLKTTLNDTINMFTSYNLKPHNKEEIIHNSLNYFKETFLSNTIQDNHLYLLGQPLSELGFITRETYLKYINQIRNHYQDTDIIYIPHRFEKDLADIKILKDNNFTVQPTGLPIELQFMNNNIYPLHICSFWSSALFTLNILYPDSSIIAFKIASCDAKKSLQKVSNVYDYIESSTNINIINLL
ncbi:MAG: hypothetical protein ACJAWW_000886 [Sulfurimonas sp.]|jgi:hypothetical protein